MLGRVEEQSARRPPMPLVNGEDLSLDHGFPARIIVPALPGHNTKGLEAGLRVTIVRSVKPLTSPVPPDA